MQLESEFVQLWLCSTGSQHGDGSLGHGVNRLFDRTERWHAELGLLGAVKTNDSQIVRHAKPVFCQCRQATERLLFVRSEYRPRPRGLQHFLAGLIAP